ncbi:MAG: inositol monophosphatase family protein, partial [Bacillota bacterium]
LVSIIILGKYEILHNGGLKLKINLEKTLDKVKKWAKDIGQLQFQRIRKNDFAINKKTSNVDLVTEVDSLSEKKIIEKINNNFPAHSILAEEGGEVSKESSYTWIIDPLDGTNNYANGYPLYCVSIALEYKDEIVLGVVYVPELDQLFCSTKDNGAYLNDKRLEISKKDALDQSLLATGFPYDKLSSKYDNLAHFEKLVKDTRGIRRSGSAAFDLCNVAAGRLDGFWEFKLKVWDVAAAKLIIQEAGGQIIEEHWDGNYLIVAANKNIAKQIYHSLKEVNIKKRK